MHSWERQLGCCQAKLSIFFKSYKIKAKKLKKKKKRPSVFPSSDFERTKLGYAKCSYVRICGRGYIMQGCNKLEIIKQR